MSELPSNTEQMLETITVDMAERGWSHLATDIDPLDTIAVRSLFEAIGRRLTVDTDTAPEISIIAPRENTKVLASSSKAMSFHTDNVYLDKPCRSIALFCAVQAEEGGANNIISGLEIAKELPMEMQDALSERRWQWMHPATQNPSDEYPVVDSKQERLRWWRMSLLNRDMASIAIANTFEEALNSSDTQESLLMQPGDVLLTDNTRILHNRAAFVGDRRIYRARFW